MNFDDFTSMQIDGQEITELRIDGVLVWEKNTVSNDLILSFTGNNFNVYSSSEGLTGQDIVIDWGDGATTNYTGVSDLNHTYSVSGDYFITITGITSLGTACFRRCSGLTNVIIPKGVTSITSYCFEGCSSLIDVVFSDTVTSLGDYCFSNIGLTSIVIPDTITYLGYYCFYNCSSLTSVVIPNTVISLKSSCFKGCSSLETLVLNWTTNPPTYNSLWIKNTPSSLKFSIPYGTTNVYTAAGYPLDKLEEREEEHSGVTPTVNNIALTSDKSILSAYDSDTCTLTATVNGINVDGLEVEFFNGTTSLGTSVVTNGVATKSYTATSSGDMTITAKYGDLISNSCNIIDAKYYASNETISSAPTYDNDRTLFASDYTLSEGDKVHFRFKSMPTRCIYGFGSTAGSDFTFEKSGTTLKYWRNVLTNGSYNNPTSYMPSTENDIVMEFTKYNASTYRMKLYKGDTYVDYWTCGNSIKKVRVDKFFNDDFEIEAFVL